MALRINIEIGHEAQLRAKKTPEGFTHDWKIFVRGCDGADIQYYVEKVVFYLHETFPKPKRVIKEPPYTVKESGYAGFNLPIEIYLRNSGEPKKIKFNYDLNLQQSGPPLLRIQKEKYIFNSTPDDFKQKLLKGGGVLTNSTSNNHEFSDKSNNLNEEKYQLISKPKLSSSEMVKKSKQETSYSNSFQELFGTPITKTTKTPEPIKAPTKDLKNSSKSDKDKSSDKPKNKHSPHKDPEKSDKKSKDEKKNKDKNKDRDRSKEKNVKKERTPKPQSPSPKHTPPRPPSPSVKHREKESSKPEKKDKVDEKKSKKERRDKEHSKDKHREVSKSEHKTKESKTKEPSVPPQIPSNDPVQFKPEKPKKEFDKPKEEEKDFKIEKSDKNVVEKIEDKKHKHKKKDKDKKERKEEKHKSQKKEKEVILTNVDSLPTVNGKDTLSSSKASLFDSPKNEPPPVTIASPKEKPLFKPSFIDSSSSSSSSREPSPAAEIKKKDKSKKKERKSDKIPERKRKRKASLEAEQPPEKLVKEEIEQTKETSDAEEQPAEHLDIEKTEAEDYMTILRGLQHKIMALKDNSDLQKVVQLIAETGQYEISAHTFDFDLCLLDRSTVKQLQEFLSTTS